MPQDGGIWINNDQNIQNLKPSAFKYTIKES